MRFSAVSTCETATMQSVLLCGVNRSASKRQKKAAIMKLSTCKRCGRRDVPVRPHEWDELGRRWVGLICGECEDELEPTEDEE